MANCTICNWGQDPWVPHNHKSKLCWGNEVIALNNLGNTTIDSIAWTIFGTQVNS